MPRLATPRTLVYVVLALMSPQALAQAQTAEAQTAAGGNAAPATSSGDPPEAVQAQYRDVVARAVVEFDAGRWAEARALFLRAHELWPSARTFRTLGMTSFELRAYAQSLQELQAALDDARRPLADAQRAQVAAVIDQTRAFVGRYRVQVSPAEAQLFVDGAPRALGQDGVLVLEVGRHELRARAPGHSELIRRLDVRGREDETLALELLPIEPVPVARRAAAATSAPAAPEPDATKEPRGSSRLFTWVAGGTAVALAGTSLALWLISDSKFDARQNKCRALPAGACERGTIETAGIQNTQTAHQVTAVLAGVAGAAAVALYFIEGAAEETPRVAIGPTGVYARGRF